MGFLPALCLVFIILKLCSVVAWPWFWVLLPLLVVIIYIIVVLVSAAGLLWLVELRKLSFVRLRV